MPSGLLYGLVAAVGWGLVDVVASVTGKRLAPIAFAAATQAVVLAVIFRNEHLTPAQWLGVALTTAGIVLAALVLDDGLRKARPVSTGVAFALIACLAFAFATVG